MPKTILVIDDDDQFREMLKEMLEEEGYNINEAQNGKIGIDLYRKNPADLVITDLFMPEKEGIETITDLRQEFPDAKIIAISGGGTIQPSSYLALAEELGVLKSFEKPFRRNALLETIQELI